MVTALATLASRGVPATQATATWPPRWLGWLHMGCHHHKTVSSFQYMVLKAQVSKYHKQPQHLRSGEAEAPPGEVVGAHGGEAPGEGGPRGPGGGGKVDQRCQREEHGYHGAWCLVPGAWCLVPPGAYIEVVRPGHTGDRCTEEYEGIVVINVTSSIHYPQK